MTFDEVIAASCQCMTCNHRFSKKYDPPIAWELYMEQRDRNEFLCEKCNTPSCKSIAHFEESDATTKELGAEPEVQKMASMDEWRILIKAKHNNLQKVIEENLSQLWLPIQFILSIRSIMNIHGVTLPWFGILLGRASSLKLRR